MSRNSSVKGWGRRLLLAGLLIVIENCFDYLPFQRTELVYVVHHLLRATRSVLQKRCSFDKSTKHWHKRLLGQNRCAQIKVAITLTPNRIICPMAISKLTSPLTMSLDSTAQRSSRFYLQVTKYPSAYSTIWMIGHMTTLIQILYYNIL